MAQRFQGIHMSPHGFIVVPMRKSITRLIHISAVILWLVATGYHILAQGVRSDSARGYLERGASSMAKGEVDLALADFELAVASDPKLPDAWYNRAVARYCKSEFDEALSDLDQTIKLDPAHVLAWVKHGNVQMQRNLPEEAISDFTTALHLKPSSVLAVNNRGLARQQMKDYAGARDDYEFALRLNDCSRAVKNAEKLTGVGFHGFPQLASMASASLRRRYCTHSGARGVASTSSSSGAK